jgi:hypothetical protein
MSQSGVVDNVARPRISGVMTRRDIALAAHSLDGLHSGLGCCSRINHAARHALLPLSYSCALLRGLPAAFPLHRPVDSCCLSARVVGGGSTRCEYEPIRSLDWWADPCRGKRLHPSMRLLYSIRQSGRNSPLCTAHAHASIHARNARQTKPGAFQSRQAPH